VIAVKAVKAEKQSTTPDFRRTTLHFSINTGRSEEQGTARPMLVARARALAGASKDCEASRVPLHVAVSASMICRLV